MVQLSLPKNSEVKKGKYFKDKTGSKNLRKVNIYRWDPSTDEGPRIDTYEVDMDKVIDDEGVQAFKGYLYLLINAEKGDKKIEFLTVVEGDGVTPEDVLQDIKLKMEKHLNFDFNFYDYLRFSPTDKFKDFADNYINN